MSLSREERSRKMEELISKHAEYLDSVSARKNQFKGKVKFFSKSANEEVISCFPSELNNEDGIYLEFTTDQLVPISEGRELYYLKHNPFWEEEYAKNTYIEKIKEYTYLVPINLLNKVDTSQPQQNPSQILKQNKKTNQTELFDSNFLMDFDEDLMFNQMSVRDLAAILWQQPVSQREWLNKLIREVNKSK
jgi:hypothetical protein